MLSYQSFMTDTEFLFQERNHRNDPFSRGSRLSYRRENSLPAPYEIYASSSGHTSSRLAPSSQQPSLRHGYSREQLQMREGHYIDGYMAESDPQNSLNYRTTNRQNPSQQQIYSTTYEDTIELKKTIHMEATSTKYDMRQMKANPKRSIKRQSDFINSSEAGRKLFRGFIGPYYQRP